MIMYLSSNFLLTNKISTGTTNFCMIPPARKTLDFVGFVSLIGGDIQPGSALHRHLGLGALQQKPPSVQILNSQWTRVICPTKFKNWRTLKSFWGIIYHICGVSLPPIPGHLELGGTQRIDILIKVILHCKMVQIGHFQRVIREVSRGCLMVPIFLTGQDMSIFR